LERWAQPCVLLLFRPIVNTIVIAMTKAAKTPRPRQTSDSAEAGASIAIHPKLDHAAREELRQ